MKDLNFIKNLKVEVEGDIDKVIKKLNINTLIKFILVTMEDIFNMHHVHKHPTDFSKEIFAEELSYVLFKKLEKDKKKINLYKIINEDYKNVIEENNEILHNLYSLLMVRNQIRDMEIYIEKQGYILQGEKNILKIEHPIKQLQHYDKLGYLRNNVENLYISMESINQQKIGMDDILSASTKHDFMSVMNYEIRSENTERELILFNFAPIHLANLTKFVTNEHDSKYNQIMSKYFDNSQIELTDKCTKKGKIKWIDLFNVSLVLHYISLYVSKTIEEKATSDRMANNSKLLLMTNEQLESFFYDIFITLNDEITMKDVKNFINRFTINLTNNTKRIDLQFSPIIRIDDRSFVLFNTFSLSDIIRAYINNNNLALDDQGIKFENEVLERLKIGFPNNKIFTSTKYRDFNDKKGEIDICLIGEKDIYFIECKNSLQSISASSATNNYEYIIKAKSQLEQAKEYFNYDRILFLKKHFNINIDNIKDYSLHKVILLSNKNISGLNFDNIAVRDIYSLDRLITNGKINTMEIGKEKELKQVNSVSLYENKTNFQEVDFLNYLNNDFIFFEEINKLAQKNINNIQYKNYILESFDYYIDMKM